MRSLGVLLLSFLSFLSTKLLKKKRKQKKLTPFLSLSFPLSLFLSFSLFFSSPQPPACARSSSPRSSSTATTTSTAPSRSPRRSGPRPSSEFSIFFLLFFSSGEKSGERKRRKKLTFFVLKFEFKQKIRYMADQGVIFEGILLKPSMVTPGADCKKRATPEQVSRIEKSSFSLFFVSFLPTLPSTHSSSPIFHPTSLSLSACSSLPTFSRSPTTPSSSCAAACPRPSPASCSSLEASRSSRRRSTSTP